MISLLTNEEKSLEKLEDLHMAGFVSIPIGLPNRLVKVAVIERFVKKAVSSSIRIAVRQNIVMSARLGHSRNSLRGSSRQWGHDSGRLRLGFSAEIASLSLSSLIEALVDHQAEEHDCNDENGETNRGPLCRYCRNWSCRSGISNYIDQLLAAFSLSS